MLGLGRAPRGPLAAGVIDFLVAERVLRSVFVSEVELESKRLKSMNSADSEVGLLRPFAVKRRPLLGAQDLRKHWLCPCGPERLLPLMRSRPSSPRLATRRWGCLKLVVAGCWVSVLQVRRRIMSLVEKIYVAQRGRLTGDIIALSPKLVSELPWPAQTYVPCR